MKVKQFCKMHKLWHAKECQKCEHLHNAKCTVEKIILDTSFIYGKYDGMSTQLYQRIINKNNVDHIIYTTVSILGELIKKIIKESQNSKESHVYEARLLELFREISTFQILEPNDKTEKIYQDLHNFCNCGERDKRILALAIQFNIGTVYVCDGDMKGDEASISHYCHKKKKNRVKIFNSMIE